MIYAYVCDKCGSEFTVEATVVEKTRGLDLRCPKCGAKEATQDFRGVGVIVGRGGRSVNGGSHLPGCGPGTGCC